MFYRFCLEGVCGLWGPPKLETTTKKNQKPSCAPAPLARLPFVTPDIAQSENVSTDFCDSGWSLGETLGEHFLTVSDSVVFYYSVVNLLHSDPRRKI